MSKETYSVGDLEHPQSEDPRFETREEAEVHALDNSGERGPLGVWHDEDGELLAIVYEYRVFEA